MLSAYFSSVFWISVADSSANIRKLCIKLSAALIKAKVGQTV
jgi:hypothetical protein